MNVKYNQYQCKIKKKKHRDEITKLYVYKYIVLILTALDQNNYHFRSFLLPVILIG